MEELDRIIEHCIECDACVEECEFLKGLDQSPVELARRFAAGCSEEDAKIAYSCSLCGLCETLCPMALNIGTMCLEVRRRLVTEGKGPLPSHRTIAENRDWAHDNFHLAVPDPDSGTADRVFFPGCILSGYSPHLVVSTYRHLRGSLPGTGIILACCGNPSYGIGDEDSFSDTLAELRSDIAKLGASELITACPECYHTLKKRLGVPVTSLYEVLVAHGLPPPANGEGATFSLHDSCSTRYERGLQDSVRAIVRALGHQIEEMESSGEGALCCGMGGMVGYANLRLSNRIAKTRAGQAGHDMLSYCASCREAFAFLGKPSLHLLDLLFDPDWDKQKRSPAKRRGEIRENQASLKSQLENGAAQGQGGGNGR